MGVWAVLTALFLVMARVYRNSAGGPKFIVKCLPIGGRFGTNVGGYLKGDPNVLSRNDYDEKRDYFRMCLDCPMTFRVQGESETHEGIAKDLSSSGLLIGCDVEVPTGSLLEVTVQPDKSVVAPLEAIVEVVRVNGSGTSGVELGTEIKEFLPREADQA